MTSRPLAALAVALSLPLAACGGSKGSATADFARAFIEASAARLHECFPGLSLAAARASMEEFNDLYPAYIGANPAISYDGAAGARCLAAVPALSCLAADAPLLYLPDCVAALKGSGGPGAACSSAAGWDCDHGTCEFVACNAPGTCLALPRNGEACPAEACGPFLSCNAGTCGPLVVPTPAPLDGSCSGAPCQPTQFCEIVNQVCIDFVPDGGSCAGGDPCGPASVCSAGTCVPAGSAGEACTVGNAECEFGLYCTGAGKCAAPAAAGTPCGPATGGEPVVCDHGWCDLAAATPTCRPFTMVGQGCSDGTGQCGPRGNCAAGLCEANNCGGI